MSKNSWVLDLEGPMKSRDNLLQCFMSGNARTIKITRVIFGFQLGNKFRLLSQQTVPV